MDRRGWIDVAFGSLVAIAGVTVWNFPLRDFWTYALQVSGWTRPVLVIGTILIILFHIAWLTLAVHAATRSLSRPIDVWKRLYPLAVAAMLGATMADAFAAVPGGWPSVAPAIVPGVGWRLLVVNAAYCVLWIPAWILLRGLRRERDGAMPPIWRRPGPWIWMSVWAVGLALEYLV